MRARGWSKHRTNIHIDLPAQTSHTQRVARVARRLQPSTTWRACVGESLYRTATTLGEHMMDTRFVIALLGAASLVATAASGAPTMPRAWVSVAGVDHPTCGPASAPCRTFQYTHDNVVVAGGSIFVKDSAGYGPIVISKSISIINDGAAMAAIFASSGDAIRITSSD